MRQKQNVVGNNKAEVCGMIKGRLAFCFQNQALFSRYYLILNALISICFRCFCSHGLVTVFNGEILHPPQSFVYALCNAASVHNFAA